MDGYVMFTLTKAPAENWVNEGRVMYFLVFDIIFINLLL